MVAEAYGEGEPRYRMLEPVRQYGRERLEEGGEAEVTRERHAGYYLALVEEAAPKFRGVDQQVWVERLERERGNLRAALGWALEQEEAEPSLRLSGALGRFWNLCGYLGEGRRWLEAALAKRGGPGPARAKALIPTGWIAWSQGDYELSLVLYEECLRLSREIGDGTGVAAALHALGWAALFRNEPEQASLMIEEAIAIQREANDRASIAVVDLWGGYRDIARRSGRELGLTGETLDALTSPAEPPSRGIRDMVLHVDTCFSLGFIKPFPDFGFGTSEKAFGTPGFGTPGFADPDARVGFAYAPNRMGFHNWDDAREKALRDALIRCLRRR